MSKRGKKRPRKFINGVLPSGTPSLKDEDYVSEWQEFNGLLQKALVSQVTGFDPNVLLVEAETGFTFRLPISVAQRIVAMYLKEKSNAVAKGV